MFGGCHFLMSALYSPSLDPKAHGTTPSTAHLTLPCRPRPLTHSQRVNNQLYRKPFVICYLPLIGDVSRCLCPCHPASWQILYQASQSQAPWGFSVLLYWKPLPLDSIRFVCRDPYQDKLVIAPYPTLLFFISFFYCPIDCNWVVFIYLYAYSVYFNLHITPLSFTFKCYQLSFDVGYLMPAPAWS